MNSPGEHATISPAKPRCRFCGATLRDVLVDLGPSPLCEQFLTAADLHRMEPFYPLTVYVCHQCYLVQLDQYVSPESIFTEYAYFSSYSESWLAHARNYVERVTARFELNADSRVLELASNDGYLLQYFLQRGVPALGIEPAANVAKAAAARGVRTLVRFFGRELAKELVAQGEAADLVIGNNVLAQVPDLNDFVAGIRLLLKRDGVVTLEFPHLLRLLEGNQFDTIYHEHFSYFSFSTTVAILRQHELRVFDVEELKSHGGSLRVYACPAGSPHHERSEAVERLLQQEQQAGLTTPAGYQEFEPRVRRTKRNLLSFLIAAKADGKRIAGYGAPGKGNTLLNYCGIRTDFLDFTVDRNPYKHGRFCPGSRIPICAPERIAEIKPDYVLILPWNLKTEIMLQLSYIREWGGRFVTPIPDVAVFD